MIPRIPVLTGCKRLQNIELIRLFIRGSTTEKDAVKHVRRIIHGHLEEQFPLSVKYKRVKEVYVLLYPNFNIFGTLTPLMIAIIDHNWIKAINIINEDGHDNLNLRLNEQDLDGMTALMYLVKIDNGHEKDNAVLDRVANMMLSLGADIECVDSLGRCALRLALNKWDKWVDRLAPPLDNVERGGRRGILMELILQILKGDKYVGRKAHKRQCEDRRKDDRYRTLLAIRYIKLGASVNILHRNKSTLLYFASQLDDRQLFDLIVKNGGDSSVSSKRQCSYLCQCASNYGQTGRLDIDKGSHSLSRLRKIVFYGADVHAKCEGCGKVLEVGNRMNRYHRRRVEAISSYIDYTGVCKAVGILIRQIGGECVTCLE